MIHMMWVVTKVAPRFSMAAILFPVLVSGFLVSPKRRLARKKKNRKSKRSIVRYTSQIDFPVLESICELRSKDNEFLCEPHHACLELNLIFSKSKMSQKWRGLTTDFPSTLISQLRIS